MGKLKRPLIAVLLLTAVTGIGFAVGKLRYKLQAPVYGGFEPHLVKQHLVKTKETGEVLQTEEWDVYTSSDGAMRQVRERHNFETGKSDVIEYIVRPGYGIFMIFPAAQEIHQIRDTVLPIQHLTAAHFENGDSYIGKKVLSGVGNDSIIIYGSRLGNAGEVWKAPDYGLVEFYYKETSGNITIERTTVSVGIGDENNVYRWPLGYRMINAIVKTE